MVVVSHRHRMFNGVKFSPHVPSRLLMAESSTERNTPNGYLSVLDVNINPHNNSFQTPSALLDCSWSTQHHDFAVSGAVDGSLAIFNVSRGTQNPGPHTIASHLSPILSVDWGPLSDEILAGSAGSVKLWHADPTVNSANFPCEAPHSYLAVAWNPFNPNSFAGASTDRTVTVWDTHTGRPTNKFSHLGPVLSCDWSKSNQYLLATSSVKGNTAQCRLSVFDVRFPDQPLYQPLFQRDFTRSLHLADKVRFARHSETVLLCTSNNNKVDVWDRNEPPETSNVAKYDYGMSMDRIYGLDVSRQIGSRLVACTGVSGTTGMLIVWRI